MNKRILDWGYIDMAVNRLYANILKSELKFEAVYGLPRGGLVPAVMLSHRLKIPFATPSTDSKDYDKILVVDDICDSGHTLQKFKEYEGNIYTATIHYKNSASCEPDFWFRLASDNEWIVYPWETPDSETIQDYKVINDGE